MILLDTTILVAYLRTKSTIIEQILAHEQVSITGVTRAELLHGAKDDDDYHRLLALLNQFPMLPLPDSTWDALGANLNRLRRAGISVPFPDALIATVAALNDLPIWSFDAHYALIQSHFPGPQIVYGAPGCTNDATNAVITAIAIIAWVGIHDQSTICSNEKPTLITI